MNSPVSPHLTSQTEDVGFAELSPPYKVVAGEFATWTIAFRVGRFGMDDNGRLKVCLRINGDWGEMQFGDPAAPNFVSVTTDGSARVTASFDKRGHERPWLKALTVHVDQGCLRPGETILITLGDRSEGGPGFEVQPFVEREAEFRILGDVGATGRYVAVPCRGRIDIVAGPPAELALIAPSDVAVGAGFRLGIALRDKWGNASPHDGTIHLSAGGVTGMPASVGLKAADGGTTVVEGLRIESAGIFRIEARLDVPLLEASSNAIEAAVASRRLRRLWGDPHGQSSETCGTGTMDHYFRFARHIALLDFVGHQGNDFETRNDDWERLARTVSEVNVPGAFAAFMGYEWSGTTGVGGDHNVMFRGDDVALHRSGHWLLEDRADIDSDRASIEDLRKAFRGREDVMLIPHVGGRYANTDRIDTSMTPLVEIWSTHGEFEWMLGKALARGLHVGVSCSSDDHTGRPGATRPGRGAFNVRGGLLCVLAERLDRDSIWAAIRARRCYGTTGERILLELDADGATMGEEMSVAAPPLFRLRVSGTAPIERVSLRRGMTEVAAMEGKRRTDRIRIAWRGLHYPGRGRRARWDGDLTLEGCGILDAKAYSFDRLTEGITTIESGRVAWVSQTAGDTDGVELQLDRPATGRLRFRSPIIEREFDLDSLGDTPIDVSAGGFDLALRLERALEPLANDLDLTLQDPNPVDGETPYHFVVLQSDGAKAWTSPIWVNLKR